MHSNMLCIKKNQTFVNQNEIQTWVKKKQITPLESQKIYLPNLVPIDSVVHRPI